jgi:glycosyltransferase involved in cell wall biosynthesis
MTQLQVALLVGRAEEGTCGVRDYTYRLELALRDRGIDAEVIETEGIRSAASLRTGGRVLHLQYPSVGEGRSLAPLAQLLRSRRSVVTIHEFTQSHALRRALSTALATCARRRITTSEHERTAIATTLGGRRDIEIIPVGSSIAPPSHHIAPIERHLAYFGLLRADKGIITFLESASELIRSYGWTAEVIGATASGAELELDQLRSASDPRIAWTGTLPSHHAAARLASAWCVYLPYPDGVSERRSSLLAALTCGAPVITTEGAATTPAMKQSFMIAATPAEAVQLARRLGPHERALSVKGFEAFARSHDWATIGERHEQVYRSLIKPDNQT